MAIMLANMLAIRFLLIFVANLIENPKVIFDIQNKIWR
jgi:hypothetical protein